MFKSDPNTSTKRQRPTSLPRIVSENEGAGESQDFLSSKKAKMTDDVRSEMLRVESCMKRALETQQGIRMHLSRVWDHSVQLSRLYEKGFKEMDELDGYIQALRRALAEN